MSAKEMVIKVVGLEEFYGEFKGILNKYPKEIASIMGKILTIFSKENLILQYFNR